MATVYRVLQTSYINGQICGPGRLVVLPEGVEAGVNLEVVEASDSSDVLYPPVGVHVAAAIFNPQPEAAVVAPVQPGPQASILDGTVAEITPKLAALSDDELAKLRADEEAGKTRKGVIAAIDAELERRTGGEF